MRFYCLPVWTLNFAVVCPCRSAVDVFWCTVGWGSHPRSGVFQLRVIHRRWNICQQLLYLAPRGIKMFIHTAYCMHFYTWGFCVWDCLPHHRTILCSRYSLLWKMDFKTIFERRCSLWFFKVCRQGGNGAWTVEAVQRKVAGDRYGDRSLSLYLI